MNRTRDEGGTGMPIKAEVVLARVDVQGAGRTWIPIHFVLERPEPQQQVQ